MPEPSSLVIFAIKLKFIADTIRELISFIAPFFDGPAGSGGVFRKAAKQAIHEMDRIRDEIYPTIYRNIHEEPHNWWTFLRGYQQELNKIHNVQSDNFVEYEGANLLGATFFSEWTNVVMTRDHYALMMEGNAAMAQDAFIHSMNTRKDMQAQIDQINGGGSGNTVLQDLIKRVASLESLTGESVKYLQVQIDKFSELYRQVLTLAQKLEKGEIGLSDPETELHFDALEAQLLLLDKQLKLLPTTATTTLLQQRITAVRVFAEKIMGDLAALRQQVKNQDVPGLQRQIQSIQQSIGVLPAIQTALQQLQNRVAFLAEHRLPELKRDIQAEIDRLKLKDERLQDWLEQISYVGIPAVYDYITDWIRGYGERKKDIIARACECGYLRAKDYVDKQLTCKNLLTILCECRDSADPEIQRLWECIVKDQVFDRLKFPIPRALALAKIKKPTLERLE